MPGIRHRWFEYLTVAAGFGVVVLARAHRHSEVVGALSFLLGVQLARLVARSSGVSAPMKNFDPSKIRPLWNRVLIEEDTKPTVSEGGNIILPDTARDAKYSTAATVLAVGRGKLTKEGKLIEIPFKVGDRVILGKKHGVEVHGDRIRMVDVDLIDGLYEDEPLN